MRIAITGGSGALGRALIRRLITDGAERIVTFTRDQHRREALTGEFGAYPGITDRIYCHDLSNPDRLERTFTGCEVVVHAAAAKVVGAHPDEPELMDETNVQGTKRVVAAATRAGVRKVLIISSDKAVQATNVYGISKALAERQSMAANSYAWPKGTRISALRYGNVLSSTGSVAVKWRHALSVEQSLDLSDLRMTRFWVTLDQAVGFVFSALDMMRGGEVFAPQIPAAPIATLAQALGGAPPYRITGIRPGGEKLHESMLDEDEVRRALNWRGFYVVPPDPKLRTWDSAPWEGAPVSPDLVYRSDVWRQIDADGMRELLGEPAAVTA